MDSSAASSGVIVSPSVAAVLSASLSLSLSQSQSQSQPQPPSTVQSSAALDQAAFSVDQLASIAASHSSVPLSDGAASSAPAKPRKVTRKDKQKHNESESRRRSRLRTQFLQLRDAARSNKKDRFSILQSAIDRFGELENRLKAMEKRRVDGAAAGKGDLMSWPNGLSQFPLLASIPCAFISLDGRFSDVNDAFLTLFSTSREAILSLTFFAISHPSELIETFAHLKSLLSGELAAYEGDKVCISPSGVLLPLHLTLTVAKRHNKAEFYIAFFVPKNGAKASQSAPQPAGQTAAGSVPSIPMAPAFPGAHALHTIPIAAAQSFPSYLLASGQLNSNGNQALQPHLMIHPQR